MSEEYTVLFWWKLYKSVPFLLSPGHQLNSQFYNGICTIKSVALTLSKLTSVYSACIVIIMCGNSLSIPITERMNNISIKSAEIKQYILSKTNKQLISEINFKNDISTKKTISKEFLARQLLNSLIW